jgi:uncharacterized protein YbaP (TraB family)
LNQKTGENDMNRTITSALLQAGSLVAMAVATPALAQATAETATSAEIIVTARRSGAPMWEVTRGDSTVLLVGAIQAVPAGIEWRPDALEQATRQARRVYFPQRVSASPADLFRVIWRSRTLTRMPEGKTSADYLSPEWQARLDALERRNPSASPFFFDILAAARRGLR